MNNIVLFGAGGLAREVLLLLDALKTYNVLGFVVNEKYYEKNSVVGGYPVLGTEEWIIRNREKVSCVCAIGTPKARAAVQESLTSEGVNFISLVHPSVRIPETSQIGKGCIIQYGSTVSADCVLGEGVFLNTYCTIGHDAQIGSYTCIMPGTAISGGVKIGREVNIGGHSYVIPRRKIGDFATIAAGSIVFTNIKARTTVIGNPAKRMPCLESQNE